MGTSFERLVKNWQQHIENIKQVREICHLYYLQYQMEKNFTNATKLENSLAHKIRRQIAKGNYKKATASYNRLQNIISNNSNNVVIISLSLSLSLSHTHTQ